MIKSEEKGYKLDIKRMAKKCETQLQSMKEKTQFKMEAMETAMIELKYKCRQEVERAMMFANE